MSEVAEQNPYGYKNVLTRLQDMKLQYAKDKIYSNPVTLLEHFTEFEAYTSILESHYATQRESEERRMAEVKREEWLKKQGYDQNVSKPSERMTQGEVDKNVEYRMRDIKATLKLLETETRSCRSHVNAMQSILKKFGDEAKSIL